MALDLGPKRVEALVAEAAAQDDRRRPIGRGWNHDVEGRLVFPPCGLGAGRIVAVRLVDGDHVRDLQQALLDALQLVAGARQHQRQEEVGHLGDSGFGLADADGLDQDDVIACRFHDDHGFAGGAGDAAKRARGWRRPNERGCVRRQCGHPRLVAKDAAMGPRGCGIDRQHRHPMPRRDQHLAKRFDEGAFADARHARDADPIGLARIGVQDP